MESKNKIFVRERMGGKSVEEAAQIAGISDQELLSARRAESGTKGGASKKRIEIQEQLRRKQGRQFQEQFDLEKAAVEMELKNLAGYVHDDLFHAACSIIEDIAWQRKYPKDREDMWEEYESSRNFDGSPRIPVSEFREQQQFCSCWIDAAALTIIDLSKDVELSKLPGLKQLVIKALTKFEERAAGPGQNTPGEDFIPVISKIHWALPRIKDNSIYDPVERPQLKKPSEEQIAAFRKVVALSDAIRDSGPPSVEQAIVYLAAIANLEACGGKIERRTVLGHGEANPSPSFYQTRDSLADQAARQAEQEQEQRILAEIRKRTDEAQRLIEQERLRTLPNAAIRFLQEGR